MEEHEILDRESNDDALAQMRASRKKFLLWILVCIVLNTLLFAFVVKDPGSITERILGALFAFTISFNILGFLLGTLVALFPYKGLPYKKKYLRASLLTIVVIQSFFTICLILLGLMSTVGWY